MINSSFTEYTWCKIKLRYNAISLVGVIYRSSTVTEENNLELLKLLNRTKSQRYTHLLIMGDFNYPNVDFMFLKKVEDLYLNQHATQLSTKYRVGCQSSLLDLVFTNEENMIDSMKIEAPLGKSD